MQNHDPQGNSITETLEKLKKDFQRQKNKLNEAEGKAQPEYKVLQPARYGGTDPLTERSTSGGGSAKARRATYLAVLEWDRNPREQHTWQCLSGIGTHESKILGSA